MAYAGTIIGLGELVLTTSGGREHAGGLAALVATHAARLGYLGVAIGRIGQDEAGERILAQLRAADVLTEHVQTDPDLPTARLTHRSIGGRSRRFLDARTAFDNLQWDFDLVDIAQRADAVVVGELARRVSETRVTSDRFLAECRHALRVYDLVNRLDDQLDRASCLRAMESVDGVVVDSEALRALVPASSSEAEESLAGALLKRQQLSFVVVLSERNMRAIHLDGSTTCEMPEALRQREAAIVGLVHGLLRGWDWQRALAASSRYASFIDENPEAESLPENLFAEWT